MCICSVTSGSTGRTVATCKEVVNAIHDGSDVFLGSTCCARIMERALETLFVNGKISGLYILAKKQNGWYKPFRII